MCRNLVKNQSVLLLLFFLGQSRPRVGSGITGTTKNHKGPNQVPVPGSSILMLAPHFSRGVRKLPERWKSQLITLLMLNSSAENSIHKKCILQKWLKIWGGEGGWWGGNGGRGGSSYCTDIRGCYIYFCIMTSFQLSEHLCLPKCIFK